MKKLSLLGFMGLLGFVLAGCPVWGEHDHCGDWDMCGGSPGKAGCYSSADCQQNETCGEDLQCHSGDCTITRCSAGFVCAIDSQSHTASCVEAGGTGGSGGVGGATGGASTGGSSTGGSSTGGSSTGGSTGTGGNPPASIYCGNPADCTAGHTCAPDGTCQAGDCTLLGCVFGYACGTDGACKPTNPATCAADGDCATGLACVSGVCTQASDLCFDKDQCDSGDKCVAGKCTIACSSNANCRDGFGCDTTLGVCTKSLQSCQTSSDCGGASSVCLAGACVPRSTGGTCSSGDVWDENGCIPNQSPVFVCSTDGQLGDGTPGNCANGEICIHRSCYTNCGSNPGACAGTTSPQCTPVTSSSGNYFVCGSAGKTFGSECDPTASKACAAGKVCIDGFCK